MRDICRTQGIQRQTLDYSCGAAALSILLDQYFEDPIGEEDILADIVFRLTKDNMVKTMTEGFSMLDLKPAAERLGYTADGVRLPANAVEALKGPVIILLRTKKPQSFCCVKRRY